MKKKLLIISIGKHREFGVKTILNRNDIIPILIESYNNRGLSPFFEKTIFVRDIKNDNEVFEQIISYLDKDEIIGVITYVEHLVPVVARIAEKFRLPTLGYANAINARNKWFMRQRIRNERLNFVNQPRFKYLSGPTDPQLKNIDIFPSVIKPLDMAASIGVKKISSKTELFFVINNTPNYNNKGYLFEEYIVGEEYSAEGYVQKEQINLLCLTKKKVDKTNSNFIEVGHELPVEFNSEIDTYIYSCVCEVISALQLNNCVFHLEFKLTEDSKFYFIEIGARPAGGFICDLIYHSLNYNLYDILIDISIGKTVNIPSKVQKIRFSGVRFFLDEIPKLNWISNNNILNLNASISKNTKIINSNIDRTGYVQVSANTIEEVRRILWEKEK
ncbi:ATP-grasp domain-containing protein [Niallia sp. FSL K6-0212]|uniref:ATP-grasp domain-containing protein n=1 Tax=Niallia sp. FSL K6-0212 TaxID=2921423 RepID=UPI0030F68DBF